MTPFSMFLALQPELRDAWHLSNTAAGWISSAYYAGYMTAVPVLGSLTDRHDARSVWLAATAVAVLAVAGFAALATGLWTAVLFQFMAGASLAGTYMPGLKLIADRLAAVPHPRHVAFYTTSFTVGSSLSFYLIGQLDAVLSWRAAIAGAAAGPIAAWLLVALTLAPAARTTTVRPSSSSHWRAVFTSREAMRYVLGYASHMWELFAMRSWLVPFLAFCETLHHRPAFASAPSLAALIALVGVPSSLVGAELTTRWDRRKLVVVIMLASAAFSVAVGLSAAQPWVVIVLLCVFHSALVSADSAALTSGMVAVSPAASRGTAMAVYSMAGFASAAAGSLAIGGVLDLFGGETSTGWLAAFTAMGLSNVIGATVLFRGSDRGSRLPISAGSGR